FYHCSCLTILCPSWSTLFPYTTLFRSMDDPVQFFTPAIISPIFTRDSLAQITLNGHDLSRFGIVVRDIYSTVLRPRSAKPVLERSEEHTSELQSRENLVCRLLLEKKKQ